MLISRSDMKIFNIICGTWWDECVIYVQFLILYCSNINTPDLCGVANVHFPSFLLYHIARI